MCMDCGCARPENNGPDHDVIPGGWAKNASPLIPLADDHPLNTAVSPAHPVLHGGDADPEPVAGTLLAKDWDLYPGTLINPSTMAASLILPDHAGAELPYEPVAPAEPVLDPYGGDGDDDGPDDDRGRDDDHDYR